MIYNHPRNINEKLTKVQQKYTSSQCSNHTEATETINNISTDDWTNYEPNG